MDFKLSVEQEQLRKAARSFLKKSVAPMVEQYERKQDAYTKEFARDLLQKMVPFGYVSGVVPEDEGGAGLDFFSYGLLLEELARVSSSLAILEVGQSIVTRYTMCKLGSKELKAKYMERMVSGELIGAHALTEPDAGSAVRDINTTALLEGDEYVINGTKVWSTGGDIADLLLVTAVRKTDKGGKDYTTFLVDKEQSMVTTSVIHKMGMRGASSVEIVFNDCRVPKENIIGTPGRGLEAALESIGLGRLSMATIALGIAEEALGKSIEYATERKQFGRPIGKFQLIQALIAEMATDVECARLLIYKGWNLLNDGKGSPLVFSMAKYFSTEMAVRVTSKAIEIHGAYGLSEDYPLERYFRDARCLTFPDATSEIQKLIIARELIGMQAFI
jgi:alkylation response protein AidB-like acyl-CoA dehydrogenase